MLATSVFIFFLFFSFFSFKIYWFMRDAGIQAEGEAGSLQGAQCGTRSWIPESRPELKAEAQPLSHPGIPRERESQAASVLSREHHAGLYCLTLRS